jgi:hypothetical protein
VAEPAEVLDDGEASKRDAKTRPLTSSRLNVATKLSGHRVVIRVADRPDRRRDPEVLQALGVAHAGVLPGLNRSSQRCVCEMNLRIAGDGSAGLTAATRSGDAAVVAEARPEGGTERR